MTDPTEPATGTWLAEATKRTRASRSARPINASTRASAAKTSTMPGCSAPRGRPITVQTIWAVRPGGVNGVIAPEKRPI